MNSNHQPHRLFFALWPTDQVRASILEQFSQLPARLKGRTLRPHNLHITLHFLGQVTEPTKGCMHRAAQSIDIESFQLVLDHFGHFSKAGILWMGPQHIPSQLARLQQKLGTAIERCGFQCENRPYAPHVTLMRKYSHSESGIEPDFDHRDFSIPWLVEHFVLVESVPDERGVNYQVIEKYPLS